MPQLNCSQMTCYFEFTYFSYVPRHYLTCNELFWRILISLIGLLFTQRTFVFAHVRKVSIISLQTNVINRHLDARWRMMSKPNKLHKKTIPLSRSRRDLPSGIISASASASGHRNRVDYRTASKSLYLIGISPVRGGWYSDSRNHNKKHVRCLDPDDTYPAESFPLSFPLIYMIATPLQRY